MVKLYLKTFTPAQVSPHMEMASKVSNDGVMHDIFITEVYRRGFTVDHHRMQIWRMVLITKSWGLSHIGPYIFKN